MYCSFCSPAEKMNEKKLSVCLSGRDCNLCTPWKSLPVRVVAVLVVLAVLACIY